MDSTSQRNSTQGVDHTTHVVSDVQRIVTSTQGVDQFTSITNSLQTIFISHYIIKMTCMSVHKEVVIHSPQLQKSRTINKAIQLERFLDPVVS